MKGRLTKGRPRQLGGVRVTLVSITGFNEAVIEIEPDDGAGPEVIPPRRRSLRDSTAAMKTLDERDAKAS